MSDIKLPPIDERLIIALDQQFPEKCPDPKMSDRDIWVYVGKRQLVRWLVEQFNRQSENLLEGR